MSQHHIYNKCWQTWKLSVTTTKGTNNDSDGKSYNCEVWNTATATTRGLLAICIFAVIGCCVYIFVVTVHVRILQQISVLFIQLYKSVPLPNPKRWMTSLCCNFFDLLEHLTFLSLIFLKSGPEFFPRFWPNNCQLCHLFFLILQISFSQNEQQLQLQKWMTSLLITNIFISL